MRWDDVSGCGVFCRSIIASFLMLLTLGLWCEGTVWYVDAARPDDSGAGTDWSTAKRTMQAAVDAAVDGDSVLVTNGVYDECDTSRNASIAVVRKQISIESVNGPEVTYIKGHGPLGDTAIRCVQLGDGTFLSGFTLTNGYTLLTTEGGGVFCSEMGTAVISNCVITGNSSGTYGGGAYRGTYVDCVFEGNRAVTGGGGASVATLTNCVLRENTAGVGGGSNASTLYDCISVNNVATNNGGGAMGGRQERCIIMDNVAAVYGGGGYFVYFYNCLVAGNTANSGGGTYRGAVKNCTVVNNFANGGGGGGSMYASVDNCIFWNNSASYYRDVYLCSVWYTCAADGVTNGVAGCTTNDPLFLDAATSNFQLQATSPCFNAGHIDHMPPSYVPLLDLNAEPRIAGDIVDMGAYERQTGPFPTPTPTPLPTPTPSPTPTPTPIPTPVPGTCDTLQQVLNNTNLVWTTGGDADWFPQYAVSHDGSCSAQSGSIGDDGLSWLETVVSNTGWVSFQWSVDSEEECDFLIFYINGTYQSQISGEVPWQLVSNDLSEAVSTLRWEYSKDGSISEFTDAGWLDQVQISVYNGGYLQADDMVDFGFVEPEGTSTVSWVISNPGKEPFEISDVTTNQTLPEAFHITPLPSSLAAGASVTCSITYNPPVAQLYTASVYIVHTAENKESPFILSLTGRVSISATRYVAAGNPGAAEPYTNWSTAASTIQDAVRITSPGDEIWVSNGVYDTDGAVAQGALLTNRVCMSNGIRLQSVNGPEVTIIKGRGPVNDINGKDAIRGVFMTNGCSIVGFTVTNGSTASLNNPEINYVGGGLWLADDCYASNCILSGNSANRYGGGVYGGRIYNSIIRGNQAHRGGGMYNTQARACDVEKNNASWTGGGVEYCTLDDCSLIENSTPYHGGGAKSSTLSNCTLVGNTAMYGGGAYDSDLYQCVLENNAVSERGGGVDFSTLRNCLLVGNTATNDGGGANGSTLINCTLTKNVAKSAAGGSYYGTLKNCIIWGNTAPGSNDVYASEMSYTCSGNGVVNGVNGCITDDPLFVDTANSNYQLQVSSSCIDTGNNGDAPTNSSLYDLAGNARIINALVDMGAYEYPNVVLHIVASAGVNGAIDPSGSVAVDSGGAANFALIPNEFYQVLDVVTNGSSAGGTGTTNFLWSNIQADGTIHVNFAAIEAPMDTPLWWLAEHDMTQDVEIAESADADGDGMLTWQEYISGTDPTNMESVALAQTDVDTVPGSEGFVVLTWLSGTNMEWRYDISRTVDFVTFDPVVTNLMPTPPVNTYTVTVEDTKGFYKIEAVK